MDERTTEKPYMDGYDWLLNNCSDLDQANHAAHLDERQREPRCFYCEIDAGWLPRPVPPGAGPREAHERQP